MLTGQAKTDYQRIYMRKRRAAGLFRPDFAIDVEPLALTVFED